MAKSTKSTDKSVQSGLKYLTPEGQENRMIALAQNLAEQQLMDGTASSQVITHYLKLGTEKAKLEREMLEKQVELTVAKTKAIESTEKIEQLYSNAIRAMREYSGTEVNEQIV